MQFGFLSSEYVYYSHTIIIVFVLGFCNYSFLIIIFITLQVLEYNEWMQKMLHASGEFACARKNTYRNKALSVWNMWPVLFNEPNTERARTTSPGRNSISMQNMLESLQPPPKFAGPCQEDAWSAQGTVFLWRYLNFAIWESINLAPCCENYVFCECFNFAIFQRFCWDKYNRFQRLRK